MAGCYAPRVGTQIVRSSNSGFRVMIFRHSTSSPIHLTINSSVESSLAPRICCAPGSSLPSELIRFCPVSAASTLQFPLAASV